MVNNADPNMPTFPTTEGRFGARTAFYVQQDEEGEGQGTDNQNQEGGQEDFQELEAYQDVN